MLTLLETPSGFSLLMSILCKWEGTKYKHMGSNRDGIDCTKLLFRILIELNVVESNFHEDFNIPSDWFKHAKEQILIDTVDYVIENEIKPDFCFEKFSTTDVELKKGDFLFFSFVPNGLVHHSAIYTGGKSIFHVPFKGNKIHRVEKKACFDYLERSMINRMKFVYRLNRKEE